MRVALAKQEWRQISETLGGENLLRQPPLGHSLTGRTSTQAFWPTQHRRSGVEALTGWVGGQARGEGVCYSMDQPWR